MIKEDGKYFTWYSKSTGPSEGFGGDVEKDKFFLGTGVTFGMQLLRKVLLGRKKV